MSRLKRSVSATTHRRILGCAPCQLAWPSFGVRLLPGSSACTPSLPGGANETCALPMRFPRRAFRTAQIMKFVARDACIASSVLYRSSEACSSLGSRRLSDAWEATTSCIRHGAPSADAAELLARLVRVDGVDYPVLVPNDVAWTARWSGRRAHAIFATPPSRSRSATSPTLDERSRWSTGRRQALAAGCGSAVFSMCFGDPWEGRWRRSSRGVGIAVELAAGSSRSSTRRTGTPGHFDGCRRVRIAASGPRSGRALPDTYGQAWQHPRRPRRASHGGPSASARRLSLAESATGTGHRDLSDARRAGIERRDLDALAPRARMAGRCAGRRRPVVRPSPAE